MVLTESNDATVNILNEYSKKYSQYNNSNVRWKQLEISLVKTPVKVRISGDSIQTIKRVADQVIEIIRKTKGTTWVRTDYTEPLQTIDLDIKKDEAARLGYSNMLL